MTKKELINSVADTTGMTKRDVTKAYEAIFDFIADTVKAGETFRVSGFASFVGTTTNERKARNPQTGEEFTVAPHKTMKVRVAGALKNFQ